MPDDLTPPPSSIGDFVHAVTKGAVGMIPLVGAPAAEILGFVIGSPLATRQREWCDCVAAAIEELRRRGVDIAKLRDDPSFTDAVLRATSVAMSTHEKEKLDALRSAILNSGQPRAIEPDLRQMFLGMVERFTGWHIRLLALFDNPVEWFSTAGREFPRHISMTHLDKLVFAAWPELQQRGELVEQVCRDLQQNGLVVSNENGIVRFMDEPDSPRTLALGKQFAQFIRRPN